MVNFVCIGFDIREWPVTNHFTADATEWGVDGKVFDEVKSKLSTYENIYQLLEVKTREKYYLLKDLVESNNNIALLSFEISSLFLDAHRKRAMANIFENYIEDHDWVDLGYDVTDMNGFFSILHMGIQSIKRLELFTEDSMLDAFDLAHAANLLVPSHAPFVVVRIRMLRR